MREFIGSMPNRISRLPRDRRGFPVPFFVRWLPNDRGEMEPHFPVMDQEALRQAVRFRKCWICGQQLGQHLVFLVGPMCLVNRLSAEPPSHYDCALFAAKNCPFLANPRVKRGLTNEDAKAMGAEVAGTMIERNPGCSALWTTRSYRIERDKGGLLFRLGPAEKVSFWAHGREATRAEVDESVATGLPILRDVAKKDDAYNGNRSASDALERQIDSATLLIRHAFEETTT